MITYYIPHEIFSSLFNANNYDYRKQWWTNKIGNLPVIYDEIDPEGDMYNSYETEPPGYWGYLEGDEQHINWILLQL